MANTHNGKALLEHHLELQCPTFKASPPGQSKLQTLKCSAFSVKPWAHAWSYWIIWDTQAEVQKSSVGGRVLTRHTQLSDKGESATSSSSVSEEVSQASFSSH